ncbi:phosphatidylserine decarboxylase [Nematocida major]|uniref:phosphatidylserine decarboxylase n=1 Tax=Nematocida major TaxID=1912982 RepID=UPI00200890F0|nr:phosphatidylserine decarboxylase [Nematocida major]KAH9385197.1 phosphatidylserine decarboxylase [Nematocida major]
MKHPAIASHAEIENITFITEKRKFRYKSRIVTALQIGAFLLFAVSIVNIAYDMLMSSEKFDLRYSIMRTFPHKTYSRVQGYLCKIPFPWPLNLCFVGAAKNLLGIDLKDAKKKRLSDYRSIGELFTRELDKGARPIGPGLTSPVDGTIVYAGSAVEGVSCPIKGINYNIEELLLDKGVLGRVGPENTLQQMVIYLSPKDYHRFHNYTDFVLEKVLHVPSFLFSVGRLPMEFFPGLLSKNERIVFEGKCRHGACYMVAVGSVGVGSIHAEAVKISTNQLPGLYTAPSVMFSGKVQYKKGSELGHFSLGSTVVLVFEAPRAFAWDRTEGGVRMGETIGHWKSPSSTKGAK